MVGQPCYFLVIGIKFSTFMHKAMIWHIFPAATIGDPGWQSGAAGEFRWTKTGNSQNNKEQPEPEPKHCIIQRWGRCGIEIGQIWKIWRKSARGGRARHFIRSVAVAVAANLLNITVRGPIDQSCMVVAKSRGFRYVFFFKKEGRRPKLLSHTYLHTWAMVKIWGGGAVMVSICAFLAIFWEELGQSWGDLTRSYVRLIFCGNCSLTNIFVHKIGEGGGAVLSKKWGQKMPKFSFICRHRIWRIQPPQTALEKSKQHLPHVGVWNNRRCLLESETELFRFRFSRFRYP